MSLGDALGNPDNVARFLLLESQVRVEHSEVELLHEGPRVDLHLSGRQNSGDAFQYVYTLLGEKYHMI